MKKTLAAVSILMLTACNGAPNQPNIELVRNMMISPAIKSQGSNMDNPDQVQMRMPPDGTVSRGNPPYVYQNDPGGAEKQKNPLAGNRSPEVLTLGQKTFEIYCLPCHGPGGRADGPVGKIMHPTPRDLGSAEAKAYTDGRIYHAITAGKGVMGSYASQITDANRRWAVVNYVRTLQQK